MQFLSTDEAIRWCRQRAIRLDAQDRPDRSGPVMEFDIPHDAQQRVRLVGDFMAALADEPECIVWFDEWSVWPSGQRMHIVDRFRASYGEQRPLVECPAQVFGPHETEDAISFVTLGVLFLWNVHVATPRHMLFFSHAEHGMVRGVARSCERTSLPEAPLSLPEINFKLTPRAVEAIRSQMTDYGLADPVPGVFWAQEIASDSRWVDVGPYIGGYERSQLPPGVIKTVDGLEVVYPVGDEQSKLFAGKTIDYVEGAYKIVEPQEINAVESVSGR